MEVDGDETALLLVKVGISFQYFLSVVCFHYDFSTSSSKDSDKFSSIGLTFSLSSFRMSPFFSNTQARSKH